MEKLLDLFIVTGYYGYPSLVQRPFIEEKLIFNQEQRESYNTLNKIWKIFTSQAAEKLNYKDDNKTILKLESANGDVLYFGKYDHTLRIGFGFREF